MKILEYETKESFLDIQEDESFDESSIYLIKETNEVYTHGRFYKRYEWKEIGEPPVNGSTAKTLDVVFANKETNKLKISRDWSVEKYPADIWEPIGIVVIPGEHGVLKDGSGTTNQCGVMSIVPMSYLTPEVGSINETDMYWGYNLLNIASKSDELGRYDSITNGLLNYNRVACDTLASNKSTQLSSDTYAYIPRQDSVGEKPSWNSNASNKGYAPSPYANDDLKSGDYNTNYGTIEFDNGVRYNVLADFKGIVNTKIITDLSKGWKEGNISNSYQTSGVYPAAQTCARFHTTGTKAFKDCSNEELKQGTGFWYLPACGELGYVIPRLFDINDTISKLNQVYGVGVPLDVESLYWTSSQWGTNGAYGVNMNGGNANSFVKNSNYYVRAFMRL